MTLIAAAEQFVTPEQARDPALNNCACINADYPSDEDLDLMIDEASDMIAIVSGFVISGRRQLLARPCRDGFDCSCPCCGLDGILLGDRNPVVDMVKINGVSIASSNYMLHDTLLGKILVRLDPAHEGGTPQQWPSTQHWWLPDTVDHTFSILYTEGLDTDRILIRDATMEILCDMVTSTTRNANVIPGAISATMGNVSVTLEDRDARVARILAGQAGPAVTKMMGILAPAGRMASSVYSPEIAGDWVLNAAFVTA